MKIFGYFRSSAAYRVRIALELKGISAAPIAIDLLDREPLQAYRSGVNPQGLVPAIETDGTGLIVQSMAIIEYIEELQPEPPLLPSGPADRAYVRAASQLIACDIHPLANLRVLRYLKRDLGHDQGTIDTWYRHWVEDGLGRLEAFVRAERRNGAFMFGNSPSMADCLLTPQMFNARRLECDLSPFPLLVDIDRHCTQLDAFCRAHPSNQPDAN